MAERLRFLGMPPTLEARAAIDGDDARAGLDTIWSLIEQLKSASFNLRETIVHFQVDQIDHVELFVPDRHAAAAWYEKTLGLSIAAAFEHWAADAQGPLMLATAEGGTKLALFTGEPKGRKPTVGFHRVAFRVSRVGFNAFLEHIKTNPVFDSDGAEIRQLTVRDHGVSWSVYFADPYGYPLEVTTYDVGDT